VKRPCESLFHKQPVPLAVIEQELEGRARAVSEDVDGAFKRVVPEHLPTHRTESVDACADIDGLDGHKDAALGGELEHEHTSRKARTNVASGSVAAGAWMHSRVPSARDSSSCVAAVGWGQGGADGTSTKPKPGEVGGTAVGDACRAAICCLRSIKRTRNCLAKFAHPAEKVK
jgi:hypothetical protein